METLQAKFAGDSLGLYNCTVKTNCDESVVPEHCWSCVPVSPPPPFAPPDFQTSGQNRITPYLVSGVCALGVAFLILTTCGILLRCRWFRRRNSATAPVSGDAVFLDEDHGPVDHPIWRIVTVGLPESVIESITAMKYKKGDGLIEGTDCSVCLTEFADGDDLRLLPKCNHAFHITCIDTWLRSHKNCPLCRSPVVNPVSSGELGSSGSARMENPGLAENVDQEEEQNQQTERDGEFDPLPLLGGRIAEILKNNRGKRAISDLGEHHRLIRDEFQPVRRTVSLDASSSASAINNSAVVDVAKLVGVDEAASSKEEEGLESNSISRLMMSSSIGRSLQKAPVSIKRSFSSSTKILSSFRASKNLSSSSILPL